MMHLLTKGFIPSLASLSEDGTGRVNFSNFDVVTWGGYCEIARDIRSSVTGTSARFRLVVPANVLDWSGGNLAARRALFS
ncbi:hypothetical protein M378DRAFT_173709 [Amanita muscaria Koide BX008]|uniref:Uncharacterized protein n=1 Tax=Amanita muscaria (strain Koide BX008) TaxID=946122 RepID=A0A0C2RYA6_AMAMK|nr:hypothetical protein M378DRAFT_173709 [Amanita muscaria Koide BX008]